MSGSKPSEISLRERNKAEKRAKIRDAAEALFRERGFEATTTQEVAERAGIAKGTVFLYAPTKSALVALVFEARIRRTADEAFATLPRGGSLTDDLAHVFGRYFAMYAEDPALARLFIRELSFTEAGPDAARRRVDAEFLARIAGRIDAHKEGGAVAPEVSSMLAAINFFALYLLALNAWLAGVMPSLEGARAHLRASFDLAIRGLLPAVARPTKGETPWQAQRPSTKSRSRSAKPAAATSKRGASATAATKRRGSS